jgi:hypothetical protein
MTFDPKAYIARKSAGGGFDPKAYINSKSPSPNESIVLQEMPDFVSTGERAIAKNFANSPEAQLAYFKKQHPDKDWALVKGEVVGKAKGDTQWRQVDPDAKGFDGLAEFGRDALDVAYDTVSGIPQAALTATAAAGAGLATGGWGAIPAAMATSGAYSAANEGMRQLIGKGLDVPQDVSGKDMLIAGGVGAASPALFGAGQLAQTAIGQRAGPAAQKMLEMSERGLLGRLADRSGRMLSSVPNEAIDAYQKHGQEAMDIADKGTLMGYLRGISKDWRGAAQANKSNIGAQIGAEYKGKPVDLTNAIKYFDDAINAADLNARNNGQMSFVEDLMKQRQELLQLGDQTISPQQMAEDALRIVQQAKNNANYGKALPDYKHWMDSKTARGFISEVTDELKKAAPNVEQLNDKYVDALNLQELVEHYGADEGTLFSALVNANAPSKMPFNEGVLRHLPSHGVDVQKPQDIALAYRYFAKPSAMPISAGGTTSTSMTLNNAELGRAGGKIIANAVAPNDFNAQNLMGTAGAWLGNYAASPAFTKKMLDSNWSKRQLPKWLNANRYNQNTLNPTLVELLTNDRER